MKKVKLYNSDRVFENQLAFLYNFFNIDTGHQLDLFYILRTNNCTSVLLEWI